MSSGYVTSVLGPVIEVQLLSTAGMRENITTEAMKSVGLGPNRNLYYVSIYDCIIVYRPTISFRDGTLLSNPITTVATVESMLSELPYHDRYHTSTLHLLPMKYSESTQ